MSLIANLSAAGARGLTGATARWIDCKPEPRQRVYFANHTSHLDFVVLWSVLPRELRTRTRPVAAKDYWQSGIRRRLAVNVFHAILVDRNAERNAERNAAPVGGDKMQSTRRALDDLLDALDQGSSLIIFPEGTRGRGDEVGPFKSGIYHLWSKQPHVQFVPVYLANLNRVLPKGEVLPVPFISRVAFGPPLEPASGSAGETKESFLRRAREALCALQHA